jgi:hypothetical protein
MNTLKIYDPNRYKEYCEPTRNFEIDQLMEKHYNEFFVE